MFAWAFSLLMAHEGVYAQVIAMLMAYEGVCAQVIAMLTAYKDMYHTLFKKSIIIKSK